MPKHDERPYKVGDTIEFAWRGKVRRLVLDIVDPKQRMVFGKDPQTGKYWQCEYHYVDRIVT